MAPEHTDKFPHYLPQDGMVNIPIDLSSFGMLDATQLNSILFADHITFNNVYVKRAHTRKRLTNNNNKNKSKKTDTSDNPGLLS